MLGRIGRWLSRVRIERDDYKLRYEHQYELKCKAQDELAAAELQLDRYRVRS